MSRSEYRPFAQRVAEYLEDNQNNGAGNKVSGTFNTSPRTSAASPVPSRGSGTDSFPTRPVADTASRGGRLADFITGGIRTRRAEVVIRTDTNPAVREQGSVADRTQARPPAPVVDVEIEAVTEQQPARQLPRTHGEVRYDRSRRQRQAQRTETSSSEGAPKKHLGRKLVKWWIDEIKKQSDHDICSGG